MEGFGVIQDFFAVKIKGVNYTKNNQLSLYYEYITNYCISRQMNVICKMGVKMRQKMIRIKRKILQKVTRMEAEFTVVCKNLNF